MGKALRLIVLLLGIALVAIAGYQLYGIYTEYDAGEDLYADIVQQYTAPDPGQPLTAMAAPAQGEEDTQILPEQGAEAPLSVDFAALFAANGDAVGWLSCEGTVINYPIMQGPDNDYYLRRMFNGKSNSAGSIFMDYRSDRYFNDANTIVYGHNMKNGSMFGTLKNYTDQAYYDAHPTMWLLTPDITYRIDLLAGFVTPDGSQVYTAYAAGDDLSAYLAAAVAQSSFVTRADLGAVERIITLSTCSYEYDSARYVLIGSLTPSAQGLPAF